MFLKRPQSSQRKAHQSRYKKSRSWSRMATDFTALVNGDVTVAMLKSVANGDFSVISTLYDMIRFNQKKSNHLKRARQRNQREFIASAQNLLAA